MRQRFCNFHKHKCDFYGIEHQRSGIDNILENYLRHYYTKARRIKQYTL